MFVCDNCDKKFTSKQSKEYHTKNRVCQKPPKTKAKYICPKCDHQFLSTASCEYHINNNVCERKKALPDPKVEDLLHKITILETEKTVLEAEKKLLIENPKTTVNVFMFPNAFGTEQVDKILGKMPNLLHEAVTHHTSRSVEYITEQIHCNKEVFPEYMNVYVRNYQSPYALVSNGERFQNKPKTRVIEDLIEKARGMLQSYIDTNEDKLRQKVIGKCDDYFNLIDTTDGKKSERRKELEVEIGGMLLDMRSIIESDPSMKNMLDQLEAGRVLSEPL